MTAPAPVPAAALDRSLRPFGESTMLPGQAYTSAEVLAWELRHLFAASWVCLGREDELRSEGATQLGVTVGDVPVLLTWVDGGVRAFANTCRHRGHELLREGCGAAREAIVCPYHAWSFRLDGTLLAAPGMREVASFGPSQFGLVCLPVEVWHGWVFVNATATAAPFTEHVGGMADLVAPYQPQNLTRQGQHSYDVRANWKVVVENFHECYHCPVIHPELCAVSPPTSGENWHLPGAWVGGSMDLRDFAETMSLDGHSRGHFLDGVDRRRVRYLGLFPNLLVSLHPDYVMTHRLLPLAPDRTRVECSWHFPEGVADPSYAVDFWDITNREDWGACESVQRGLASPHFRPGPLAPSEDAVHQWVTMIARAYRGIPPHVSP
jgi:Rieske 2Fe-2S family protein